MTRPSIRATRHGALAGLMFAIAVASRFLLAPVPLGAAEQADDPQPQAPLDTARQIQALTAGGLFNPDETTPADLNRAASDDDGDGVPDAPICSTEDSQQ